MRRRQCLRQGRVSAGSVGDGTQVPDHLPLRGGPGHGPQEAAGNSGGLQKLGLTGLRPCKKNIAVLGASFRRMGQEFNTPLLAPLTGKGHRSRRQTWHYSSSRRPTGKTVGARLSQPFPNPRGEVTGKGPQAGSKGLIIQSHPTLGLNFSEVRRFPKASFSTALHFVVPCLAGLVCGCRCVRMHMALREQQQHSSGAISLA